MEIFKVTQFPTRKTVKPKCQSKHICLTFTSSIIWQVYFQHSRSVNLHFYRKVIISDDDAQSILMSPEANGIVRLGQRTISEGFRRFSHIRKKLPTVTLFVHIFKKLKI